MSEDVETLRQALLRVLMDEYGGTREDWTGMGSLARVERIVADRVREAEQRGAVQALRDAADEEDWRGVMFNRDGLDLPPAGRVRHRLRARADRLAGDER